jgi:glycolate oxidase iron-sulfur subunit
MQTSFAPFIKDTTSGKEAEAILRKCVHCGFCTATCPTYQLLGDELDSPRGRIYLIKRVLEGQSVTRKTQLHLDRCLTCLSCETTCPSAVPYGRLVDIGRAIVEEKVGRPPLHVLFRKSLRAVLANRAFFTSLLRLGQAVRPFLFGTLRRMVPAPAPVTHWPQSNHARKMLVLEGCVQPSLSPNTSAAAARVLDRLGITLVRVPEAGCCGAVDYHLNAQAAGLDRMRRLIDAWWPHIEAGAEAIVLTASGCGAMVAEYGHLFANDAAYAAKAKRVSELAKDISEIIAAEKDRLKAFPVFSALRTPQNGSPPRAPRLAPRRVAFHPPCTLQHSLKLKGKVEALLTDLGFELTPVPDSHICCGSAGTYSILQPKLARQLLEDKLAALGSGKPEAILTANIGCQTHLQTASGLPVTHWIEALDARLG